jgi:hypothetical protein
MLKSFAMLGGLGLALAVPALRAPQSPAAGEPAVELEVGEWINHVGAAPTLSELRGKAVLIEFWATW